VLLVDDNRDMRECVRRLLSRRFDVQTATNGREALQMAAEKLPDLVLSDVMMPEMDGFELLAALRQNPETRTIPVVLLSARAGEDSRIEGLQAGADDYLVKPFTARELLARVEAHIRMARFRNETLEHEAQLEQELALAERMAAEAVEQITDGFWTYDSDFRILYMNSAAEKISRGSRVEQIGQSLFDVFPALRGSETEAQYRRASQEQVPLEFENFYAPWQRWFAHRLYPAPGGGLVDYCRDITDIKKTEQALRSAEQLAAAGRLAASISHEINNPLEAVTNLLYLAKSAPSLSEDVKHLLEIADKELQRLSHIASKSLKFYKQSSSPTAVHLSEIIESVLFFYETRLKDASVKIEKRFDKTPPVICYAGEMQQVFTNLISNALDAMPHGGKLVLSVRAAEQDSGSGVQVTVADTGMGMQPETRRNLFQPFYTTKGEAGTGLGLWVSAGILHKHGARIRVRSTLGKGTVFSMFVPRLMNDEKKPVPVAGNVA
jgi:PAS domain S-box-containing protein